MLMPPIAWKRSGTPLLHRSLSVFMQEQKAQVEDFNEALEAALFTLILQLPDGQFLIQDERKGHLH